MWADRERKGMQLTTYVNLYLTDYVCHTFSHFIQIPIINKVTVARQLLNDSLST